MKSSQQSRRRGAPLSFINQVVSAALFWLCVAAIPSVARAGTDACSLLTPAQVGAAVGVSVGGGKHATPTFVKACTWVASGGSKVEFVTLYLHTAAAYDGGKRIATQMAATGKGAAIKPAGIGDDSYYFVAGRQVALLARKHGISFKVTVYATLPVADKKAMEMILARELLENL